MSRTRALSREAAILEFVALSRRSDRPVAADHLPGPLYSALRYYFGSLQAARAALGLPAPAKARRWTRDKVLHEVRALHARGVPIRHRDLSAAGCAGLSAAVREHCGGLIEARLLAGVPDPRRPPTTSPRQWTKQIVIDEIRERHRRGEALASSRVPPTLMAAACMHVGDWRSAIEAASFDYEKIRLGNRYHDRQVIEGLKALAAEHPAMTRTEFRVHRLGHAARHHFGTIDAALRVAGLGNWPTRRSRPRLSRQEVLEALRARWRAGRTTFRGRITRDDDRLRQSMGRHFPSLAVALEAAGVRVAELPEHLKPLRRWSKDEIVEQLRRIARGRPLSSSAVPVALRGACRKHFGSFRAARMAAGITAVRQPWTADGVLLALRDVAARTSSALAPSALSASLVYGCEQRFGSVTAAVVAAGLRSHLPRKRRTREDVIQELRDAVARGVQPKYGQVRSGLAAAARLLFGSLAAAREAAGVA